MDFVPCMFGWLITRLKAFITRDFKSKIYLILYKPLRDPDGPDGPRSIENASCTFKSFIVGQGVRGIILRGAVQRPL